MGYLICFIGSLLILLWAIAANENMKINQILLILITAVGDGGYYALASSQGLEAAILANKLTYFIGIFAPMLIFFNFCEICKIKIRHYLEVILFSFQVLLYLGVCTIGKYDIFYRTVEYHMGEGGAYLTKTYGPLHSVYVATLFFYFVMMIGASVYAVNKRARVSFKNADILILVGFLIAGTYLLERVIHLKLEMMPFVFTIGLLAILFPIIKISRFSIEDNPGIINSKMEGTAYIIFTKNLRYMGCNEYAGTLFPELLEWELEKKIPGNGGRFNTFLRQTFMKYVETKQEQPMKGKPFSIKERSFHYEVKRLYNRKKHLGYVIELTDVTDLAKESL